MSTTDFLFNRFSHVALGIVEQHGPGEIIFIAVICNGCGWKVESNSIEGLREATEDWDLAEQFGGDDFCPRCR